MIIDLVKWKQLVAKLLLLKLLFLKYMFGCRTIKEKKESQTVALKKVKMPKQFCQLKCSNFQQLVSNYSESMLVEGHTTCC